MGSSRILISPSLHLPAIPSNRLPPARFDNADKIPSTLKVSKIHEKNKEM
jgi:hypothetical protein